MSTPLKPFDELPVGAVVIPETAEQPRTGSWRMGLKPSVDLSKCVNCLLCWINCPDTAVMLEDADFYGFDFTFCKGCELCAEVCPTKAITMVDESVDLPDNGRFPEVKP